MDRTRLKDRKVPQVVRMGRPNVDTKRVERAVEMIRRGATVSEAARVCGVHRNTLGRYGVQRRTVAQVIGEYRVRPGYRPYGETMMEILLSAVPAGTPDDLREEICQQLAMEVLSGSKEFQLLRNRAIEIKKRVNREYHNNFQMMSLSQPISENGLTLGDVLEG